MPPFAGFKDFQACVLANKDKDNPEAFCAAVHKKATGKFPTEASEEVRFASIDLLTSEFQTPLQMPILEQLMDAMGIVELLETIKQLWSKGRITTADKNELLAKVKAKGATDIQLAEFGFLDFLINPEKDLTPDFLIGLGITPDIFSEFGEGDPVNEEQMSLLKKVAIGLGISVGALIAVVGGFNVLTRLGASVLAKGLGPMFNPGALAPLGGLLSEFGTNQYILENIPIFYKGQHTDSQGQEKKWSDKDLKSMITAFDADVPPIVPIKLGHTSEAFNAKIADALDIPPEILLGESGKGAARLGQIISLTTKDGQMYANIEASNEKVADLIKEGYFGGVSAEIADQKEHEGKMYGPVLTGLALLGAQRSALPNLNEVLENAILAEGETKPDYVYLSELEHEGIKKFQQVNVGEAEVTAPNPDPTGKNPNLIWQVPMKDAASGRLIQAVVSAPDQISAKSIGLRAVENMFLNATGPIGTILGTVLGTVAAVGTIKLIPGIPKVIKVATLGNIIFEEGFKLKKFGVDTISLWEQLLDMFGSPMTIEKLTQASNKGLISQEEFKHLVSLMGRVGETGMLSELQKEFNLQKLVIRLGDFEDAAQPIWRVHLSNGETMEVSSVAPDIAQTKVEDFLRGKGLEVLVTKVEQASSTQLEEEPMEFGEKLRKVLKLESEADEAKVISTIEALVKNKIGSEFSERFETLETELGSLRKESRVHHFEEQTRSLTIAGTPTELATKLVTIEESAGEEAAKGLLEEWQKLTKLAEEKGVLSVMLVPASDTGSNLETAVDKFMEENPGKTRPEAYKAVMETNPQLYTESLKA